MQFYWRLCDIVILFNCSSLDFFLSGTFTILAVSVVTEKKLIVSGWVTGLPIKKLNEVLSSFPDISILSMPSVSILKHCSSIVVPETGDHGAVGSA